MSGHPTFSFSAPGIAASTPTTVGPSADTLRLEDLRSIAEGADPRSTQLDLHEEAADLRIRDLRTEWYPSIAFRAEASYQTDVPTVSLDGGGTGGGGGLTGGSFSVPTPPKDRYEVAAEVEQLVWDGGRITRREAVERALLGERTAETRSALYAIREELNAAYFTALLQQERSAQIELLLDDLEAREELVAARVREGAALRSELAALEAERVRARQELTGAETARRAALDRLEILIDREIADDEVLAVPEPPSLSQESDESELLFTERPEWQQMEWTRLRIESEAALAEAADRPRVSLFARGAYGRPGLDFFNDEFSPYATIGARLQWPALDWGSSDRRSRALEIQAEIVETERAAFSEALRRRARATLREIHRLEATLDSDQEVVALREEIEGTARRRLEEGVLLPSEYVEARTDLFEARLVTRTHRIQLAEARVRLRTLLGPELSPEDRP
ncbi:MAG: TolC family protein [Longimicrobiales bacterium]|nr:TolC family protein [Longimicrobiales bacterium]